MEFRVQIEGVIFTATCEQGRFARGRVVCPNCGTELEQLAPLSGSAYLICPCLNRGCVKPTKSFGTERDMLEWVCQAWGLVERECKKVSAP
jgi:hypothetical protein